MGEGNQERRGSRNGGIRGGAAGISVAVEHRILEMGEGSSDLGRGAVDLGIGGGDMLRGTDD
jgi:hypothetical protein